LSSASPAGLLAEIDRRGLLTRSSVVKKNPHAEHRARAVAIGERLEVLKEYPTPPNCTSPYAPIWITEMMRRQHPDRRGHAP
jgi:hypothetical protein